MGENDRSGGSARCLAVAYVGSLTRWLVNLLARLLVGSLTCGLVGSLTCSLVHDEHDRQTVRRYRGLALVAGVY